MPDQGVRAALDTMARTLADNPAKARVKNTSATASLAEGLRFSVAGPGGEKMETDMPKGVGGSASTLSPGWALRAALASCTGTVIAMRAAKLGISLDKLDVTVDSDSDMRGMLGLDDKVSAALTGLRTRVALRAPNTTPAELEALVRWGDAHSPVACTLRQVLAGEVEVVVE